MIRNSLAAYRLHDTRPAAPGARNPGFRREALEIPRSSVGLYPQDRVSISREAENLAQLSDTSFQPGAPVGGSGLKPVDSIPLALSAFAGAMPDLSMNDRYQRFLATAFAGEPTPRGALIRLSV